MMGAADVGPQHGQDASLVLCQKINNRNRLLRRRFQHKVVAIDAGLDARGAAARSPASAALHSNTPDAPHYRVLPQRFPARRRVTPHFSNLLILMANPARFERTTSAFGGQRSSLRSTGRLRW